MSRPVLTLVVLASVAALTAGCGSHRGITATSVANCLNTKSFLVRPQGATVDGVSTSGIAFTLTLYRSAAAARSAGASLSGKTTFVAGLAVVSFRGNAPVAGRAVTFAKTDVSAITACADGGAR